MTARRLFDALGVASAIIAVGQFLLPFWGWFTRQPWADAAVHGALGVLLGIIGLALAQTRRRADALETRLQALEDEQKRSREVSAFLDRQVEESSRYRSRLPTEL